jgi:hypothetical protein
MVGVLEGVGVMVGVGVRVGVAVGAGLLTVIKTSRMTLVSLGTKLVASEWNTMR